MNSRALVCQFAALKFLTKAGLEQCAQRDPSDHLVPYGVLLRILNLLELPQGTEPGPSGMGGDRNALLSHVSHRDSKNSSFLRGEVFFFSSQNMVFPPRH